MRSTLPAAFKKGVYNYIKEEQDSLTQEIIPRKYFSGGVNFFGDLAMITTVDPAVLPATTGRKDFDVTASVLPQDQAMTAEDIMAWRFVGYSEDAPIVPIFHSHGTVVRVDYLSKEQIKKAGLGLMLKKDKSGLYQYYWGENMREEYFENNPQEVMQFCLIPGGEHDRISFGKGGVRVSVGDFSFHIKVRNGEVVLEFPQRKRIEEEKEIYDAPMPRFFKEEELPPIITKVSLGEPYKIGNKFSIRVFEIEEGKYRMNFVNHDKFYHDAELKWESVPDSSYIGWVFRQSETSKQLMGTVDNLHGLSVLVRGNGPVRSCFKFIQKQVQPAALEELKVSPTREKVEDFFKNIILTWENYFTVHKELNLRSNLEPSNIIFASAWKNPQSQQFVTVVSKGAGHRVYVLKGYGELIPQDLSKADSKGIGAINISVKEGDSVIMASGISALRKDTVFKDNTSAGIAEKILFVNRDVSNPHEVVVMRILDDMAMATPSEGDTSLVAIKPSGETSIPIIDLVGDETTVHSFVGDFEGVHMAQTLDILDRILKGKKFGQIPQNPKILLIGGSAADVGEAFTRFPKAEITVVNLEWFYLRDAQKKFTKQVRLFRADAQYLSDYKKGDGTPYFPDDSFDLIAAPGVDESAFLRNVFIRSNPSVDQIMQKIADQEARLVRPGGFISHRYRGSDNYQEEAVKEKVLKVISAGDFYSDTFLQKISPTDKEARDTGGIDLTPARMNLQTQMDSRFRGNDKEVNGNDRAGGWNDSAGIKFNLTPAMLEQLQNAPGFTPLIINIQPMTDLRRFLSV